MAIASWWFICGVLEELSNVCGNYLGIEQNLVVSDERVWRVCEVKAQYRYV